MVVLLSRHLLVLHQSVPLVHLPSPSRVPIVRVLSLIHVSLMIRERGRRREEWEGAKGLRGMDEKRVAGFLLT